MISRFKRTIDELQSAQLPLHGRRFTWSNEQDTPTMTRIDHFFGSLEWHELFPNADLQAIASLGSDHSPLLMNGDMEQHVYRGFRFEEYWLSVPGFTEMIQNTWEQPVNTQDAILRLHVKLIRTEKAIKIWRRQNIGNIRLQLAIMQVAFLHIEKAQEFRQLSEVELDLKRFLKAKSLGLASIQRSRARQHARIKWIKLGDCNTRFFHMHANARRKKQFIAKIQDGETTVTSQADKLEKVHDYFRRILGSTENREGTLNWEALGYTQKNMEDLEFPITDTELSNTIKELPSQRAPGPDGFIGAFYKSCWGIIKNDLLGGDTKLFQPQNQKITFY